MRSSTGGQQTALNAAVRQTYTKVKIADALGTMRDLYDYYSSVNWVHSVSIDQDIDQPVASCTVNIWRQRDIGSGVVSASPLRSDSAMNVSGAAIAVYRDIQVYMAVVTTGTRPASGSTEWQLVFEGLTDRVEFGGSFDVVTCRDTGGQLVEQFVTSGVFTGVPLNLVVSPSGPLTLERTINLLLAYATGVEDVYVPTDPAFYVTSFPLKNESVMDAVTRAAQLVSADFRYEWDDTAGRFRPTLIFPNRTASVPVWTYGRNNVVHGGFSQLALDRLAVRNLVTVTYKPQNAANGKRAFVIQQDATSQTNYGIRQIIIDEADDSSIDTSTEATTMAAGILADLKEQKAAATIEIFPDWRVQLGDYVAFSANDYFDTAQSWAIVGFKHVLEPDRQRTIFTVRGTPSAAYERWLKRARALGAQDQPSDGDNGLTNVQVTDGAITHVRTWTWERGANVAFVWLYQSVSAYPLAADPWPAAETVAGLSGAVRLATDTDAVSMDRPSPGLIAYAIAVPYYKEGGKYTRGAALKLSYESPGHLPVANATVSIDANGAWGWQEDGIPEQSYVKYAESTSDYPSDATAIAGTTITGQVTTRTGGSALTFGQTIYVTIVPFTSGGLQLPTTHARGSYQTFTASKTTAYGVSGYQVDPFYTPGLVTYPTASTIACGAQSNSIDASVFRMAVYLPDGVTITSVSTDLLDNAAGSSPPHIGQPIAFGFNRGTVSLGTYSTTRGSGAQTATLSLSESTTGRQYSAGLAFEGDNLSAGDLRAGPLFVTYTQATPATSI